ncbi:MAG: hypothetical protein U0838_00695 [Chloroflexota bacterium]
MGVASLAIRAVANGWVLRDGRDGEESVVEEREGDGRLGGPARLLAGVRDRLGGSHDSWAEQNIEVLVAPGRKWSEHHEGDCTHSRLIERWAEADGPRFWCFCGAEFAPVAPTTGAGPGADG